MWQLLQWIILLSVSILGMFIVMNEPEYVRMGVVMYFGGFLAFALSVAKGFID